MEKETKTRAHDEGIRSLKMVPSVVRRRSQFTNSIIRSVSKIQKLPQEKRLDQLCDCLEKHDIIETNDSERLDRNDATEKTYIEERQEQSMEEGDRLKSDDDDGNSDDDNDDDDDGESLLRKHKFDYCAESVEVDDKSVESVDSEIREKTVKTTLNADTFSFLVVTPVFSLPFFTGIFVVLFKLIIFALIMAGLVDTFDPENPLRIPTSVTGPVVVAQFLALLVAIITQDDLISAMSLVGQTGQLKRLRRAFPKLNRLKWMSACIIMFVIGALGLIVTFALIVVSPDVIELMLNFTAIEFVGLLDNIGFGLALQGLLGKANLEAAELVQKTEYRIPKQKESTPRRLIAVMLALYFTLISGWAVIYYYQLSGAYTPNTLVVQFDDEVNTTLGTYSGVYKLQNNPFAVGFNRIRYENVDSDGLFAYCMEQGVWTFTLDKESNRPCEDVIVRSSRTVSFDITESAGDRWFVTSSTESARFFPMDIFHMALGCEEDSDCGGHGQGVCNSESRCVCNEGFYGVNCDFVKNKTCPSLELHPNILKEQTGRQYPKQYTTILDEENKPLEVFDRHAFISEFDEITDAFIVVFTGLRWVLSTIPLGFNITDFSSLRDHLQKPKTEVGQSFLRGGDYLASEPLRVNSPADIPVPLGLEWFPVKITKGETNRLPPVTVDLFCATCNNETNLCSFGNTCAANGRCECTNGATGTLCENAPLGDGRCHNDSTFNVASLSFDGGDCCELTCTNTVQNTCGVTSVKDIGNIYVGFPYCADGSGVCKHGEESCYVFKGNPIPSISRYNEAKVTLTGNGRTMAIAEPALDTVRIFDEFDSNWVQRGSDFEGIRQTSFGRLIAFSRLPHEILGRINGHLANVIAIAFGKEEEGDVRVMGYFDGSFEWTQVGLDIVFCLGLGCDVLSLDVASKDGVITVAGVAQVNGGTVSVYSTSLDANKWEPLMTVGGSLVSLSADGKVLAVAHKQNQTITRYSLERNGTDATEPFEPSVLSTHDLSAFGENAEIVDMQMHSDGQRITAYLHKTSQVFSLVHFEIGARRPKPHAGTFLKFDNVLDPPIVDFSDDGLYATETRDLPILGRIVRALKYDKVSLSWKEIGNEIPVSSRAGEFAVSNDGETVIIGGDDPTLIYRLNEKCKGSHVRLSHSMGDDPSEISWFAESFQYVGNIKVPTKTFTQSCDHCYDNELFRTKASQHRCIPLDECFQFSFGNDIAFDPGFGFVFFVNETDMGELSTSIGSKFETQLHSRESCTIESITCREGQSLLTMIFDLDGHPEETSWSIRDGAKEILFGESDYTKTGRDIRQYCIASEECLLLTLEDVDGFYASSGLGGYSVYLDERLIVERNGDFTARERVEFGNCETRVLHA